MTAGLEHFLAAQDACFEAARAELSAGSKRTHWMWFIFPQLRGLGTSEMAQRFGIASAEEARAYLEHPVLGPRLVECTSLVNGIEGRSIERIFGYPDHLKFRSCMTLFAHAAPDRAEFREALAKYFGGETDPLTVARLQREHPMTP